eukprot:3498805-Rhodomonas_salina.2
MPSSLSSYATVSIFLCHCAYLLAQWCYTTSSTDLAYGTIRCYAIPGIVFAYGATSMLRAPRY